MKGKLKEVMNCTNPGQSTNCKYANATLSALNKGSNASGNPNAPNSIIRAEIKASTRDITKEET